jgi:hypothetical protein
MGAVANRRSGAQWRILLKVQSVPVAARPTKRSMRDWFLRNSFLSAAAGVVSVLRLSLPSTDFRLGGVAQDFAGYLVSRTALGAAMAKSEWRAPQLSFKPVS